LHDNGLIFSRSGDTRKLYRVSPLLYSQLGQNNRFHLPKRRDLPEHGLVTRYYCFDFGFSSPAASIGPYDTGYCPLVLGRDLLVWAVTAVYQAAPPTAIQVPAYAPPSIGQVGANASPGFLVNWLHTHNGVQRQWANKNITDGESCGNARHPLILKDPALLPQGDTITCEIQNLNNVTLQAQILFTGAEFDTETYGQEAGI
jgi:hypothetical protein